MAVVINTVAVTCLNKSRMEKPDIEGKPRFCDIGSTPFPLRNINQNAGSLEKQAGRLFIESDAEHRCNIFKMRNDLVHPKDLTQNPVRGSHSGYQQKWQIASFCWMYSSDFPC